jgi:hypothetical protein
LGIRAAGKGWGSEDDDAPKRRRGLSFWCGVGQRGRHRGWAARELEVVKRERRKSHIDELVLKIQ